MERIKPGQKFPQLSFASLHDQPKNLSDFLTQSFLLLVVYRGVQCSYCKKQMQELDALHHEFDQRDVQVLAMSMDTQEKAQQAKLEWELEKLQIAYGLDIDAARNCGLYISEATKDNQMPRFSEPGIFLIQPDQTLYAAWIASFPFARPSLTEIIRAIDFIQNSNVPPRGAA